MSRVSLYNIKMDHRTKTIILMTAKQLLPVQKRGPVAVSNEILLEAFEHVLWTGCPWRALTGLRSCKTFHNHYIKWCEYNIFKIAYKKILKLNNIGKRKSTKYMCIDTTFVKNFYGRDYIGRNPTDRGRNATKVSAIVTDNGTPVSLTLYPANVSDTTTVNESVNNILIDYERMPMYGDKGYDSISNRIFLETRNFIPNIGKRRIKTHFVTNRRRNIVERTFSWFDKCRRIIVRYDKYGDTFINWHWLASLRLLKWI